MSRLKGIPVTLYSEKTKGKDPFGKTIIETVPIVVDNVLVAPASTDDVTSQLSLYGKKVVYTIAIPKEDSNDWTDKIVSFFGQKWRTVGVPLEGIETMMPLEWNKKVTVERYE